MNPRGLILGLICLLAGLFLAFDWLPGADGFATGPRIGVIMTLWTLTTLAWGIPLSQWVLRLTTRPEDYRSTCPVGTSCPDCGAFNYKPRSTCRVCTAAIDHDAPMPPRPTPEQA